jgi:acetoin utilization protein AcuB
MSYKEKAMLTVNDLMTFDPETVTPSTTLCEAVVLMNRGDHRQLPVVEDGKLVGIISDRDIRLAVNSPLIAEDSIARIRLLDQHTVAECMTRDPITVTPATPINEVAGILVLHKFGALPVMENEALVGIISVTDLLQQITLRPGPTVA